MTSSSKSIAWCGDKESHSEQTGYSSNELSTKGPGVDGHRSLKHPVFVPRARAVSTALSLQTSRTSTWQRPKKEMPYSPIGSDSNCLGGRKMPPQKKKQNKYKAFPSCPVCTCSWEVNQHQSTIRQLQPRHRGELSCWASPTNLYGLGHWPERASPVVRPLSP